jgi:hypothetical protein
MSLKSLSLRCSFVFPLSFHPTGLLLVTQSICQSVHLCFCPHICPTVRLFSYPAMLFPYICLTVRPSVCFACPSFVWLSFICLRYVYISFCLYIFMFVCLSFICLHYVCLSFRLYRSLFALSMLTVLL